MVDVILLGSKYSGEKNNVAELEKLWAGKADDRIVCKVVYWEDLLFDISQKQQRVIDTVSGQDLSSAGFVLAMNWYRGGKQSIYREAAFTLALYLQKHDVKFWNQEMVNQRSTGKLSSAMQLALLGKDIPETWYSLSASVLRQTYKGPFPCILKAAKASRGRDNYLVDEKEFSERLSDETLKPNPYLLQEYIANTGDLRILCADNEPQLIIHRQRQDQTSHLNNVSQGAKADLISLEKLNADILQSCRDICQDMGRNIAGIDLILASDGSDRNVFLEVNAIPQLTSGAFVNEKTSVLLEALLKSLERKQA